jgi:hypothetical protein
MVVYLTPSDLAGQRVFFMAVEAPGAPLILVKPEEEYGYSLDLIAELGKVACASEGEVSAEYASAVREEAWHDFRTGVQENVVTSQQSEETEITADLRERLKFDPMRVMDIVDGHVVDGKGRPMVDVVGVGVGNAWKKAKEDSRMLSEVERAQNDVVVAELVDQLEPGELLAVPSLEPIEAIERDGEEFWNKVSIIGYKLGMAVVQVYYRDRFGKMHAGAYSIRGSSKAAFHTLWANNRVEIPIDTPANDWILHGIRKKDVSLDEAQQFGPQLHDAYQKIVNGRTDMISVTKAMQEQEGSVRQYFDIYIDALARAFHRKQNSPELRGFASAMLAQNAEVFSFSDQMMLSRIATTDEFGRDEVAFMENAIRYASGREIWNSLLDPSTPRSRFVEADAGELAGMANRGALAWLHEHAANNVRSGVAIGWFGGGCSGTRFAEAEKAAKAKERLGQQDVYGGALEGEGEELAACDYRIDACHCSPYDFDGNPVALPVEVTVVRDKHGVAQCQRIGCGAKMDSHGKTLDWGGIFERAQSKRLQEVAGNVLQPTVVRGLARRVAESKQAQPSEDSELVATNA